jgi:riboflavin synthase alpha subunit
MATLLTIDTIELYKLIGLALALIIFMVANIVFGSAIASIKEEWNKEKLIKGIKKAIAIAIGFVLVYIGGLLVPDLAVVQINGTSLTVSMALDVLFTVAVVTYAYKSIKNGAELLGVSTSIETVATQDAPIETELNEEV